MWEVTGKRRFHDPITIANVAGTVLCIQMDRPRYIFSYNVYSEVWRKYIMPSSRPAPDVIRRQSYAVLGRDVFVFGGYSARFQTQNDLWQLTYDTDGCLIWVNLSKKDQTKVPSPRVDNLMWAYGNKVYSFGGVGLDPDALGRYLANTGEVVRTSFWHYTCSTNQLLQYDVATGEWSDVVSTGDIPSPNKDYDCARIRGTVYMYQTTLFSDEFIYKLDLASFQWTKVKTHGFPGNLVSYSFTAIDCERIAIYGGIVGQRPCYEVGDIWMFDVASNTWTKHDASGPPRSGHSAIKHPHSDALLVFGGTDQTPYSRVVPFSTVQLSSEPIHQPKSLLWHALKAVDRHRERVGLSGIPEELQKKLLLPGEKVSGLDDEDEV